MLVTQNLLGDLHPGRLVHSLRQPVPEHVRGHPHSQPAVRYRSAASKALYRNGLPAPRRCPTQAASVGGSPRATGDNGGPVRTETPWSPTYRDVAHADLLQSHHIIQHARMVTKKGQPLFPGYDYYQAPAIRLRGGSAEPGSAHDRASRYQNSYKGPRGTYGAERTVAEGALRAAGVAEQDIRDALWRADRYFKGQLCLSDGSLTRPPGR